MSGKRAHPVDLTSDSGNRPRKQARSSQAWRASEVITISDSPPPAERASQSRRQGLSRALPWSSQVGPSSRADQSSQSREEDEIIDLTQEVDEGQGWLSLGYLDTQIVGIQYYRGFASVGERTLLRREPSNAYDRKAIRVDSVDGAQLGHIPRVMAAKLAPFLDAKDFIPEAVLIGERGTYDVPLRLTLFGPPDSHKREKLFDAIKNAGLTLKCKGKAHAPPGKKAAITNIGRSQGYKSAQTTSSQLTPPSSAPEADLAQLAAASARYDPRVIEKLAEEFGFTEEALKDMPMADQPQGLVSTLLPYQRQGLAFMLDKENPQLPAQGSKDVVQLWKRTAHGYRNLASQYITKTAPQLAKGGILADDMGLGKTLQVLSLILEVGSGPTLIVAPVSVMSNWAQQVERHVKPGTLKVLTYHGNSRKTMKQKDFDAYNIVITTYGLLSQELFQGSKEAAELPTKSGLFSAEWARIVLDEGHIIRNHQTKAAMAASSLIATARWVLTGTPIVNSIKDFYSMLRFIGVKGGLEQLELFNAIITRPLAAGDRQAEILLQTAMRTFCLRRKKDMEFVDLKLPERTEYIHRIAFRNDEKEKYDALNAEAKGMVRKYQQSSKKRGTGEYQHILEILLRMRQVCNHWKLCRDRVANLLSLLDKDEVVVLNKENVLALQTLLQISIDAQEECSICLDTLHNPVITACKHVFGRECIQRTIELQQKCPMCRSPLADENSLVAPAVEVKDDPELDVETKSSKTEALIKILKASRRDPASKVVIFSQWTSFLNIVQQQITDTGWTYTRIDGTMPAGARDTAMRTLDSDPDCRILLASLSVCSVGLNLVAADTVILADSWWAPAIEDQAVDRVHRLGQTRPCTVWRLIMEESIEERVLGVQAEKRKLVGQAFREKAKDGKDKASRMGDILKLLG